MIVTQASPATLTRDVLPGKRHQITGIGTFGGATVLLEAFVDGRWIAVPSGSWTASFEVIRDNGDASQLRLTVSGRSGTTDISIGITELPK